MFSLLKCPWILKGSESLPVCCVRFPLAVPASNCGAGVDGGDAAADVELGTGGLKEAVFIQNAVT